jgi:hypothetical protein
MKQKLPKKTLIILGLVVVGLLLLSSLFSGGNALTSGSTYNRTPDGYGAWYQYMEKQGHRIDRYKKSTETLIKDTDPKPTTLLRVQSSLVGEIGPSWRSSDQRIKSWVDKGNTLVMLGVQERVSDADFSSQLDSPRGQVSIDTRRRRGKVENPLLEDRHGAVVWSQSQGKGKIIYATTPYLAANAYQKSPGNFKFLEQLVTSNNPQAQLWVDEYIHGYRDKSEIKQAKTGNIFSYLADTPLWPLLLQGFILLGLLIWGNRRFGKAQTILVPKVANSEAYIQALAGALQKSDNSAYILDIVGKAELLALQKKLGLNNRVLDPPALIAAWSERTKEPRGVIERVLKVRDRAAPMTDGELTTWLNQLRSLSLFLD